MEQLRMIPLRQLVPDPGNRVPTPEAIKAMAASLKALGQIQTIAVVPTGDDLYMVKAGGTRLAAWH